MTEHRKLIEAVKANAKTRGHSPAVAVVLDAVPDGWAKVDGTWVQMRRLGEDSLDWSWLTDEHPVTSTLFTAIAVDDAGGTQVVEDW